MLGNNSSPNLEYVMRINVSSSVASSAFAIATLITAATASAAPIAFTDEARREQGAAMIAPSASYEASAPIGSSDRARALGALHATTVQHQSTRSAPRTPGSTDEARALSAAGQGAVHTG